MWLLTLLTFGLVHRGDQRFDNGRLHGRLPADLHDAVQHERVQHGGRLERHAGGDHRRQWPSLGGRDAGHRRRHGRRRQLLLDARRHDNAVERQPVAHGEHRLAAEGATVRGHGMRPRCGVTVLGSRYWGHGTGPWYGGSRYRVTVRSPGMGVTAWGVTVWGHDMGSQYGVTVRGHGMRSRYGGLRYRVKVQGHGNGSRYGFTIRGHSTGPRYRSTKRGDGTARWYRIMLRATAWGYGTGSRYGIHYRVNGTRQRYRGYSMGSRYRIMVNGDGTAWRYRATAQGYGTGQWYMGHSQVRAAVAYRVTVQSYGTELRYRVTVQEPVSRSPCALLKLDDLTNQCICCML